MSGSLDVTRESLELWGFTPEEVEFILDPAYLEASREAKDRMKACEGLFMERVDEINRILAPVGLRYDVRSILAE